MLKFKAVISYHGASDGAYAMRGIAALNHGLEE